MYKYILFISLSVCSGSTVVCPRAKGLPEPTSNHHQEQQDHVIRKKSEIYARPNPDRDTLLKLMRNGTL